MTAAQYVKAIHALGLTQEQAGEALGMSRRQGQRYATGQTRVPVPVSILLDLLLDKMSLAELRKSIQRSTTR